MNNKEEEYFNSQETLTAWLAVVAGCDPNPFNVNSYLSVHFSSRADLQGALLWFILISQVSTAVPKGEHRMAFLYCTGTKEAI